MLLVQSYQWLAQFLPPAIIFKVPTPAPSHNHLLFCKLYCKLYFAILYVEIKPEGAVKLLVVFSAALVWASTVFLKWKWKEKKRTKKPCLFCPKNAEKRKKDRYGWFKVSDQVFVSQQGVSANHCCSQMINKETSQVEGVLWGQDRQAVGHREGQLVWNLHPILLPALHVHWNNQRDIKFYLELIIALGSRTKWTTWERKYTKKQLKMGSSPLYHRDQ